MLIWFWHKMRLYFYALLDVVIVYKWTLVTELRHSVLSDFCIIKKLQINDVYEEGIWVTGAWTNRVELFMIK